jgi:dihydrofolate reductase
LPIISLPVISLIIAVSRNGVIGRDNELPWRLRSDLQRFKRLTIGHTLLMGRKTFDSLPKVLPGRKSIVLTNDESYHVDHDDVLVVNSMDAAIKHVSVDHKLYIIGGASIYRQFAKLANEFLLTRVHADVEGDTFIDPFDSSGWHLQQTEYVPAGEHNEFPSTFEHWTKSGTVQAVR